MKPPPLEMLLSYWLQRDFPFLSKHLKVDGVEYPDPESSEVYANIMLTVPASDEMTLTQLCFVPAKPPCPLTLALLERTRSQGPSLEEIFARLRKGVVWGGILSDDHETLEHHIVQHAVVSFMIKESQRRHDQALLALKAIDPPLAYFQFLECDLATWIQTETRDFVARRAVLDLHLSQTLLSSSHTGTVNKKRMSQVLEQKGVPSEVSEALTKIYGLSSRSRKRKHKLDVPEAF